MRLPAINCGGQSFFSFIYYAPTTGAFFINSINIRTITISTPVRWVYLPTIHVHPVIPVYTVNQQNCKCRSPANYWLGFCIVEICLILMIEKSYPNDLIPGHTYRFYLIGGAVWIDNRPVIVRGLICPKCLIV